VESSRHKMSWRLVLTVLAVGVLGGLSLVAGAWASPDRRGLRQTVPSRTPTPPPTPIAPGWRQVAPELAGVAVRDILIHPENREILMACTWGAGLGVYVSEDQGASWRQANNGLLDLDLYRLAQGALPWTVYAASENRLWRTSDGGWNWDYVEVNDAIFTRLSGVGVAPNLPGRLYVTAWEPCRAIFVSSDYGDSWQQWQGPDLCSHVPLDSSIAVSHLDPDLVYLARGHDYPEMYRSEDAGRHWAPLSPIAGGEGVNTLALDPNDDDHLYAATFEAGVWTTLDGGVSWQAASYGLPGMGADTNPTALWLNPEDANMAYVAIEGGGVYRTNDGGTWWQAYGSGFPSSVTVYALAASARDPTRLWAATSDGIWVMEPARHWLPLVAKRWVVSPTATPTATAVPVPTPTPQGCYDVIEDGGFEDPSGGAWQLPTTPHGAAYTGEVVHSGSQAVRLGIEPSDANVLSHSSVYQTFVTPADAVTVTLRYWCWRHTEEELAAVDASWAMDPARHPAWRLPAMSLAAMGDDVQEVLILDGDWYTLVAILDQALVNDGGWVEQTHDLTAWRGESLVIYFNAYNDGASGRTWMYVDDVAIQVCPAEDGVE